MLRYIIIFTLQQQQQQQQLCSRVGEKNWVVMQVLLVETRKVQHYWGDLWHEDLFMLLRGMFLNTHNTMKHSKIEV